MLNLLLVYHFSITWCVCLIYWRITHCYLQEGAPLALRKHLEEEARDLSGEAFSRFMDQLYDRISTLLESNDPAENLGALRAIDELIDVALGENASKVSKFSSYMRTVFEVKRETDILELASRVLGHLARAGGAMTADEVERQVCCIFFSWYFVMWLFGSA